MRNEAAAVPYVRTVKTASGAAKAESAVAGLAPVTRNRFIRLSGGKRSANRDLEAKATALAVLKGYATNLQDPAAEFVIGAYHRLFHRRPADHRVRRPAVSRSVEQPTGWTIKKFIRTARRCRTVCIRVGDHTITAADPLRGDPTEPAGLSCWAREGLARLAGRPFLDVNGGRDDARREPRWPGHVTVAVTLRRAERTYDPDTWSAQIVLTMEAGEDLRQLADAAEHFFAT